MLIDCLAAGYAYYGEYPLAFAACRGNQDIYDYLIDHGANPNFQDSFGNTVLHMVVIHCQPVSIIVMGGKNYQGCNVMGRSHLPTMNGHGF